jgi:hypothetical protein
VRSLPIAWILSIFLIGFSGNAGSQTIRHGAPPPGRIDPPVDSSDDGHKEIAQDMAKKANLERQVQLKNDTDKLLKLSQELKEYVDKSNENMLSVSVLKKAEEIEKLARSVKDKMKGPN